MLSMMDSLEFIQLEMMNELDNMNFINKEGKMGWGSQEGLNLIILHDAYILMSFSVMVLILTSFFLFIPKKMMMITTCMDRTKKGNSNNPLEFSWTVGAMIVLALISYYSLLTFYNTKYAVSNSDSITVKVIGHQWYWEYEYVVNIHKALSVVGSSGLFAYMSDCDSLLALKEAMCNSLFMDVVVSSLIFSELYMWSPSNWENFMGMNSGGGGDDDPDKNRNNQNQKNWFSSDSGVDGDSNKSNASSEDASKSESASGFSNSNWGVSNPEGSFIPESNNTPSPVEPSRNPEGWFEPEPSGNESDMSNRGPVVPREMEGMVHEPNEPDPGMDMNNNMYNSQNRNLGRRS
nr:COX2 [Donax semistriatus]